MHATFLGVLSCSVLCSGFLHNLNDYRERIVPESAESPGPAEPRIIGGEEATIEEYPFAVSLQYNGTFFGHDVDHFCGGSIIGEKWIITSAQCALKARELNGHVRAGSRLYYKDGQVYHIENIMTHPRFSAISYDYDFGLVKLLEGIRYDSTKQAIKLPREHAEISDGAPVRLAGWGARRMLGPVSDELYATVMPKISNQDCDRIYADSVTTERMFCLISGTASPCIMDSGSGAVFDGTLYGVTSWSESCMYEHPTAYAAVSEVTDWIGEVTGVS